MTDPLTLTPIPTPAPTDQLAQATTDLQGALAAWQAALLAATPAKADAALPATLDAALAEIAQLRAALDAYAQPQNWEYAQLGETARRLWSGAGDNGFDVARKALGLGDVT